MKEFQALTLFLGLHIEQRNSEGQMMTQGKTILTGWIGREPRQKKLRVKEYGLVWDVMMPISKKRELLSEKESRQE